MLTEKQMNYLWCQLCKNYNVSYQNTQDKKAFYYEYLKNYKFEDLKESVDQVIINNKYFPNVAEILNSKNRKDPVPEWFNQDLKKEETTKEEVDEMDKLLDELIEADLEENNQSDKEFCM